ncbi:SAM-dependent methyltransferase [Gallibacterium anatis]|nr:SAM-dependent methyltransferase [Gallibacterium anatis]
MAKAACFQFKQFKIYHDRCAMKVGTDGVLLGAWADVAGANRILDLGCGTGLIALMLAQRSAADCQIVGVEIEENAYCQALDNVAISPWSARVTIYHQSMQQFCQQSSQRFDLIVANPPYFESASQCRDQSRETARYVGDLSHLDWLLAAENCLSVKGKIQFVLPFQAGICLQQQLSATSSKLCCTEVCHVITKEGKMPQRMLLTFAFLTNKTSPKQSELTIYDQQHCYHSDVIPMFKPFYLKL